MTPYSQPPLPSPAGVAAAALPPSARWVPGRGGACHHGEVFAPGVEATGTALAVALALDGLGQADGDAQLRDWPDRRPWLWVQDKAARRLGGRPYGPGLPLPLRSRRLVHVAAATPEDALFALEEGVRCRDFAFVLGEIAGNPRALGLTASRRLSLAAEKHGVPLWLVRLDARRDLGSARMRWEARAAPSLPPRWNPQAPGVPAWHAELFRARSQLPGEWVLRDDGVLVASSSRRTPGPLAAGSYLEASGPGVRRDDEVLRLA